VAQRRNRGTDIEEVLEDPTDVGIVAEVLGSPPAGHHHRNIIGRIHVGECDIGRPRRPGFSVYVSKPSTKSWTTNCKVFTVGAAISTWYPSSSKALVGVHHFEILGSVAGQ